MKSETKSYVPEGGWNEETFAKHGKTLMSNFVSLQRNERRGGQKRLKTFLNALFYKQIEDLVEKAEKTARFKLFKSVDPWTGAIAQVFANSNLEVGGNLNSIQEPMVTRTYKDSKRLLGESAQRSGLLKSKERSYKLASQVTKINETTRKILRQEIAIALSEGATVAETSKRLRDLLPRMRRRIPTIVRTEMARATDMGVKQALVESKVLTHCSVIGCEKEEPLFTYNGQSTCNVTDVPVAEVDGIDFHINHTGAWVPSKFKTIKQLARDAGRNSQLARASNPAKFPSKPRRLSRDSYDSHTKASIFNEQRAEVHQSIKNNITGNTGTAWGGVKAMVILGGGMLVNAKNNPAFSNNNPNGRVEGSVDIDPNEMIELFPEWSDMQKSSRMGSLEQTYAYLYKETAHLKEDLISEMVALDSTAIIHGLNTGKKDRYAEFYDSLKENGHKLEGFFQVPSIGTILRANKRRAEKTGFDIPNTCLMTAIEDSVQVMNYVQKGVFSKFYLYDGQNLIFTYEDDKSDIKNFNKYQSFLLLSRQYNQDIINGKDLPFLKINNMTSDPDVDYATETHESPDARDTQRMAIEIITGVDIQDSELQPFTEKYKEQWKTLETEVAILENQGNVLSFGSFLEI